MRIKQDQRGISNVIVFVLGLVIVVVIVSNVFLWNYEMNQLDWGKMQENMNIANVTRATRSSWFAAQSEYSVNIGSHVSGNYTDTQTVNGQYETFTEASLDQDWLTDWDKRIKIAIDHNDITDTLDDFPVLLYLSNSSGPNKEDVSCVFDEIGSNKKKIAVTTSDGTTQCYVEIERWNATEEKAWLWVEVPSISNSQDTVSYLYYDNDHADNTIYVGEPNSTEAEMVWDNDFKWILHLHETSGTHCDSTSNDNSGSPQGGVIQNITGKIDGADDFDGINDRIQANDSASLSFTNNELTIEAWIKLDSLPTDETAIIRKDNQWQIGFIDSNTIRNLIKTNGITGWTVANDEDYSFQTDTWYYWTSVYDGSRIIHKINAEQVGSTHTVTGNIVDNSNPVYIAYCVYTGEYLEGIIDEVRISNIARSAAWIKASFESGRDHLLDFGSEEIRDWWNTNYDYRKRITITNNMASTLDSGYSVLFTVNTTSLVSSGKMLSNGNDLRIVFRNESSWVEMDRDVIDMNTSSTQVWFKTQADISASSSDNSYYMYYCNPSAVNPPANKSNVYDFWDDFDDASLDPEWTFSQIGGASGSVSESGTVVMLNATNSGDLWSTSDSFLFLSISRSYDILIESYTSSWAGSHGTWSKMGGVQLRQSLDANSKNRVMSPVYTAAGATNSYRLSTGGITSEQTTATQPKYNRLSRIGGTSRAWYSSDGKSWTELGSQISFTGSLSDPVPLGIHLAGLSSSSHSVEVDWFKVRKYVDPEPSTSLGSEESQSNNSLDVDGAFVIDMSTYPLTYIQTVEIQLRYMANDTSEDWYLKAYNWTSSTYSDSGFNSTAGHTPTTGWDYYTVNLTDQWNSYVQNNGTINVKFLDEGADINQTTIDIDFLGVRALINGTRFTFKNKGSLSSYLVSLWILNSTHHQRHDIDLIINPAQTLNHTRADITLPSGEYIAKVVTERGNIATYSGG